MKLPVQVHSCIFNVIVIVSNIFPVELNDNNNNNI